MEPELQPPGSNRSYDWFGMMLEHLQRATRRLDVEVHPPPRRVLLFTGCDKGSDAVQQLIENNGWSPRITSCAE